MRKIINCPNCNRRIFHDIYQCHCGFLLGGKSFDKIEPKEEKKYPIAIVLLIITLTIAFSIIFFDFADDDNKSNKAKPIVKQETSGRVDQVRDYLQANLKDPNSLEFISWYKLTKDNDGNFNVSVKYRAKNSFGGYAVEVRKFYISAKGYVIDITDAKTN